MLEGVTITGGRTCHHEPTYAFGAGVLIDNSSATIKSCHIVDNFGLNYSDSNFHFGGGVGAFTDEGISQVPDFIDDPDAALEAALSMLEEPENIGEDSGAQGPLHRLVLANCVLEDNTSGWGGAGNFILYTNTGARAVLVNCWVKDNVADKVFGNGSFGRGGGIYGATEYINCLFTNNNSNSSGGAIHVGGSQPTKIVNSTFRRNTADGEDSNGQILGGAIYAASNLELYNSILYKNYQGSSASGAGHEIYNAGDESNVIVTHNLVDGGPNMVGGTMPDMWTANQNKNPKFISPANDNYRLTCDADPTLASPCIDKGNNAVVPNDLFDVDDDGDFGEATPDIDHFRRIRRTVDQGYSETLVPISCDGDTDGDMDVDVDDMGRIFVDWSNDCPDCDGNVDPPNCLDNAVDTNDLGLVFVNWGVCEVAGQDSPQSVDDCHFYCTTEENYQLCVDRCVEALCILEIIDDPDLCD